MTLVILLAIFSVCSALLEEPTNLRGVKVDGHSAAAVFANQETAVKLHEKKLNEYINKLYKEFEHTDAKALDGRLSVKEKNALVNTSPSASMTHEGFLISREYKNDQCTGDVVSVVGRNLNCRPTGDNRSAQYYCYNSGDYTQMYGYEYEGRNCSGAQIGSSAMGQTGCNGGQNFYCVDNSRVQGFTKKEGLMTYKFQNYGHCITFATNMLNYYPNYGEADASDFDDDYEVQGPCCTFQDAQNGCPYNLCPGEEPPVMEVHAGDRPSAPVHVAEQLPQAEASAPSSSHAAPLSVEERTARRVWWEKQAKAHTDVATTAATPASEAAGAVSEHSAGATSDKHTATGGKEALWIEWYREYAFTQMRNSVCVYDEKYGLYVKTSCHGKSNTLVYFLFLDRHCTKAVKRTVHQLDQAIPGYGACLQSTTDDRATLTICHNESGPDYPYDGSGST